MSFLYKVSVRLWRAKEGEDPIVTQTVRIEKETPSFLFVEEPINGRVKIDKRISRQLRGWYRTLCEARAAARNGALSSYRWNQALILEYSGESDFLRDVYTRLGDVQ